MSNRAKCQRDGHKFREIQGVMLSYVFCARWGCDASAVSRWADPILAVDLHNAIPIENRVPPVDLDANGQPVPTTTRGEQSAETNESEATDA